MPQEKARSPRAGTTESQDATPPRAARTKKTENGSAKAAAAKKPAAPRTRKQATKAPPSHEAIALHAYLLWEQGEPGDPDEHWRRAEQELSAA